MKGRGEGWVRKRKQASLKKDEREVGREGRIRKRSSIPQLSQASAIAPGLELGEIGKAFVILAARRGGGLLGLSFSRRFLTSFGGSTVGGPGGGGFQGGCELYGC